ncbi:MAG: universal stress protein [Longimicrobiaceae bacterium]
MPQHIRTIVVGVASAAEPDLVLEAAVDLAERLGATLHVANVFELPDRIVTAYAAYAQYVDPRLNQRYADEVREHLLEQVKPYRERVKLHCHALEGSASDRLCALATALDADLMILGATRRGRLTRYVLGTTAERILRASPVPVLVLGERLAPQLQRVLMTTDLSPQSSAVYRSALDVLHALLGEGPVELRSLLVIRYDTALPPPLRRELLQEAAEGELARFLEGHQSDSFTLEPRVRTGDPVREIIAEAAEWPADLVVLGTRGQLGAIPFALGSTAAAMLRAAPCNALVIPAPGAEEEGATGPEERQEVSTERES